MAEFLALATEATGYSIGDILHVSEDGALWGGKECLEPGDETSFLVVRIDMALEEAKTYCVPLVNANGVETAPSRYRIDINTYISYDELAHLCTVEWEVPILPVVSIIDKATT